MSLYHWRLLIVMMVAETVSAFEVSMVFAGLGAWMRIYGDPIAVGWIVSSFLFVSAGFVALCARFGDMFGRKRVLLAILVLAAVGSAISAFATDLAGIILGRAIQGVTGAVLPLCFGLTRELLPEKNRPLGIGYLTATAAIASAAGLILGGVLTDAYGPQSIFAFSAGMASLAAIIVAFGLPATKKAPMIQNIDWLGGLLLAPGVVALMLSLSNIKKFGIDSPNVWALALFGAAILSYWSWWENRHDEPMIDVKLLRNPEVLWPNLVMVSIAIGIMNFMQHTSLLLQQDPATGAGMGTSATLVGILKFPGMILGAIASVWAGWIGGRRGGAFPMLIGCAVLVFAGTLGALVHDNIVTITIFLVLVTTGATTMSAGVPTVIIGAVPPDRTSEATGITSVMRSLAMAVGAQLLAVILAISVVTDKDGKTFPSDFAYTLGFWWMTATAAIGLFISWRLYVRSQSAKSSVDLDAKPTNSARANS